MQEIRSVTDFAAKAIWHCEPRSWSLTPEGHLGLVSEAETDFWQRTHYGFRADNGHFLHVGVQEDFLLRARLRFTPLHQYDQAGLMVRISPDCWLKTSVEHEPEGRDKLGAVVTNAGYSDWSTQEVEDLRELSLSVLREGSDYTVRWSADGQDWRQLRIAHLVENEGRSVRCGIYACSPKGGGFLPEFLEVEILSAHGENSG